MEEKYCVLPGQKPVRLTTIEGGATIIIGEEPREIPEIFKREAIANGCFSESMLAGLKGRLQGPVHASGTMTGGIDPGSGGKLDGDKTKEAIEKEEAAKKEREEAARKELEGKDPVDDPERPAKIKAAAIEIINAGNPTELTSGKPRLDALAKKLGYEVTGAERDAALL